MAVAFKDPLLATYFHKPDPTFEWLHNFQRSLRSFGPNIENISLFDPVSKDFDQTMQLSPCV